MNIKKILFIFFTLLFLCSCGENKNDEKTDTISTIEETKSQDEVEIDDYVSDEEFDEAILFPKNAKGIDLMSQAPSEITEDQLNEYGLKLQK